MGAAAHQGPRTHIWPTGRWSLARSMPIIDASDVPLTDPVASLVEPSPTVRLASQLGATYCAQHAAVVGDLTAWALVDMPFDGQRFAIEIDVPPGRCWHYRFLVDGHWMNDPDADDF